MYQYNRGFYRLKTVNSDHFEKKKVFFSNNKLFGLEYFKPSLCCR